MGERMGKAERIEIEDFVQNIVERMETPEAFEKMISREEECEAQGRESRLRDVLKKEWPVDEKGERIYQITNIYEEKAEELLIVELYTGIHLENGVPCGHFTLYLCGEPDGWKLSETRIMEYLQNLSTKKQNREDREKKNCPPAFAAAETPESQDPYGRFSSLMPTR